MLDIGELDEGADQIHVRRAVDRHGQSCDGGFSFDRLDRDILETGIHVFGPRNPRRAGESADQSIEHARAVKIPRQFPKQVAVTALDSPRRRFAEDGIYDVVFILIFHEY